MNQDRLDVIRYEATPLEFCEALGLTTTDLVEAFMDRLLEDTDNPLDSFYWLKCKYKEVSRDESA